MEVWKDIKGYEGLYQISSLGKIKSLGNEKTRKEKLLKPSETRDGYLFIGLNKNGERKKFRINRLVAEAFIFNEDPENKTHVNHINEFEKKNNSVTNLEWVTPKENNNHGTHNKRQAKARSKRVYQYNLNGELIKEWESTNECERNGFSHSAISLCCNNKYPFGCNTYKGFIWSYRKQ